MTCYSNASLNSPLNDTFYYNSTLQSCQCLIVQKNMLGFQYNWNDQSCYTFVNNFSLSNIQLKANSQVCVINQTTMVYSETTTTNSLVLPSPPISVIATAPVTNYYSQEIISLTNSVPLTSLSIVITVLEILGVQTPTSSATFWTGIMNNTITDTGTSLVFAFNLIPGNVIGTGQWQITAQFSFESTIRPTITDTYMINITSYQPIYGHF